MSKDNTVLARSNEDEVAVGGRGWEGRMGDLIGRREEDAASFSLRKREAECTS